MKRKIGDLDSESDETARSVRQKVAGPTPVEIIALSAGYLLDPHNQRGTAKNLGSLRRTGSAGQAGVLYTAEREAFVYRLNRLGRIADSMCELLLSIDNRKAIRWVSSDIPEGRPEVEHLMHDSFSIRGEIGIARCVEILKPVLSLLSDDQKTQIVDHINALSNRDDRTNVLDSIKDQVASFQEREQIRLVEGADRIIKSRTRHGGDVDSACKSAIEFVAAVEGGILENQDTLKKKVDQVFFTNSEGRDDIIREINLARSAPANPSPAVFDTTFLSHFIQNEVDKMKNVDIDKDIDHIEKTINKALAQYPSTSAGFLKADRYASDIAYAMRPLRSLIDRVFEKAAAAERASYDAERRKLLALQDRPRRDRGDR